MKKLPCLIFAVAILIASTSVSVRAHSGDVLTAVNGSTPTIDGSIGVCALAQGDTTIFSEDFEGAFPGSNWLVADADSGNGGDYWDDTFLNSHGGSYSAWCADVGSQLINTTIWTEDFEGAFPTSDYQVVDFNADSGYDCWDDTNYRSHGGAWSAWCAQNGTQSEALPEIVYNWEVHRFDNNMWTDIMRWADLSSYSFATFSFWYWFDTGDAGGILDVVYHTSNQSGGENTYVPIISSGSSGGWTYSSTIIPSNAVWVMVGFFSDATNCNGEGAYVDDMAVVGCVELPNRSAGMYDDNMEAGMLRQVDLTTYSSVTLSYWYWLSAEPSWDYLKVLYTGPEGSVYIDPHTGNSSGWQYSQVSIPTTAYEVGFLFSSDSSVHNYEGAYVDDVLLVGTKRPPPTVESCDQAGTRKDIFRVADTVYVSVSGYLPNSLCVIYFVQDTTWTDGMSIAPVSITLTTTWSDGTGHVNAAPVYYPPLALGKYDVVFDVNDNGVYDAGTDALDDNDVEATAGLTVREWNPGDINHDGVVDILDIVIVAVEFGHPPPPIVDMRADVNKDGVVDILDIVTVAGHFGETG